MNTRNDMIIYKSYITGLIILFTFYGCNIFNPDTYEKNINNGKILSINEFLASNSSILADEYGEFDDWVEIYNKSEDSIDIGGMYISGDPEDNKPFYIPDNQSSITTIAPGDFLVLWFDRHPEQGVLHIDNRLSKEGNGEAIILIGKDGNTILDSYEFNAQKTDISTGRYPDGSNNWTTFKNPTPGASNN